MIDLTAVVTNGTLLTFAGSVIAMLRDHHRRIDKVETATEEQGKTVAQLRTAMQIKEGVQI